MNYLTFTIFLIKYLLMNTFSNVSAEKNSIEQLDDMKNLTIFDKNLLEKTPNVQDILKNHNQSYLDGVNRIKNTVFGFISGTNDSYKEAIVFGRKFAYISPPWFNIKRTGHEQYSISGEENFDREWIENLMKTNPFIKVVPTITFDDWTPEDFIMLAYSDMEWISLANKLVDACEMYNLHGLVLDVWVKFYGRVQTDMLIPLIQEMSARLRNRYFEAILLMPANYLGYLDEESFGRLAEFVNAAILMTSDFSIQSSPVSYAPINWIEKYIKEISPIEAFRKKILLGLNFFGKIYSSQTEKIIEKNEYLDSLEFYDDFLIYDENTAENYFQITINNKKHTVVFPTLQSLNERINLANKLEVGVAIFKIGNGLEYFYELL